MYIQEHYLMQKVIRQRKKLQKEKILITKERAKEHREKITRGESPSPRSFKKRTTKRNKQLVIGFFHVLKSPSISLPHHIRHNGTKFQIPKECFPNQFHQLKRVSAIDLGKTHEIPKDLKAKLHNQ